MAVTAKYVIADASNTDWLDSSGNDYDASASGTPTVTTEDGYGVVELNTAGSDKYVAPTVPGPTVSCTYLCFAKLPSAASPTYTGLIVVEGVNSSGLMIAEPGVGQFVSYIWNGTYSFAGIAKNPDEICMYAVTVDQAASTVKVYRIDSDGTVLNTHGVTLSPLGAEDGNLIIGHRTGVSTLEGFIRHAEYHRNIVLTQEELEAIYEDVMTLVDVTPPDDVTGLTGDDASPTQADLNWDDASDDVGVTDYRVFYNTTNSHVGQSQVDVGSATSAKSVTGLTPGQTYYFWVKAKDAAGNFSTNYSTVFSLTMPEAPPVADFTIPAELEASDKLIPENTSTGATSYEWRVNDVLVSTDAEPDLAKPVVPGTNILVMGDNSIELTAINGAGNDVSEQSVAVVPKYINVGNVTSYVLENLSDGLTLQGRVRAIDGAGNQSGWSNTDTATVGESSPGGGEEDLVALFEDELETGDFPDEDEFDSEYVELFEDELESGDTPTMGEFDTEYVELFEGELT